MVYFPNKAMYMFISVLLIRIFLSFSAEKRSSSKVRFSSLLNVSVNVVY